jgi:hypothetical protein
MYSIILVSVFSLFTGSSLADTPAHPCRPFTSQIKTGDRLLVKLRHFCNPDSSDYFGIEQQMKDDGDGQQYSLALTSIEYPADKTVLDQAIAKRLSEGLERADIKFFRETIIPLLKDATSAPSEEEREKDIQKAKDSWKEYLIKIA